MHGCFDLYVCTKFEVDHSFRSKLIIGLQNFAPSQTLLSGAQDCKNLISWRFLLPAPTDLVS